MNSISTDSNAQARRPARRTSIDQVLTSSAKLKGCATALWEGRTAEGKNLLEDYASHFHYHDKKKKGTLSVNEVYDLLKEGYNESPGVSSVVDAINCFSADDESSKLNLAEFTTMMRYLGKSDEMHGILNPTKDKKMKPYADDMIGAAIALYQNNEAEIQERIEEKLSPINPIIIMKGVDLDEDLMEIEHNPLDIEFNSVYGPNQMRCLALVSHNGMKDTMLKFVMANKNALKKFRLTGTNSTMTMLKKVFHGDDTTVFGPACKSGPLGGDAQLVAMLCDEQLGGVIFFQDPLDSHPHTGDIDSLLRNIKIYNIMHASTTVSATMMMHTLRCGLQDGQPELLPSFFKTLECPSVAKYRSAQKGVIERRVASMGSLKLAVETEKPEYIEDDIMSSGSF